MNAAQKPFGELNQRAIDLLCSEIGVAETLRFLGQFNLGTGNYTEERDALIGHLTLEEIIVEAREIETAQTTEGVRVSR
jgi:hypothetical protein